MPISSLIIAAALQAAPADYSNEDHWLCRPGREDLCAQDVRATIINADGSTSIEPFERAGEDAPFDCFYVYPTVSTDLTGNSDMTPDAAEERVIQSQFARFASVCRPFAPQYRQVTLTALRSLMAGQPIESSDELAYGDVRAAFHHYLENDNDGRPFLLVGHSQGSRWLNRLIQDEIDGQPLSDRMLSAMLMGWNVQVLEGDVVGGDFDATPLCRSADQTGCAISYVSFRDSVPPPSLVPNGGDGPPSMARFARARGEGLEVGCTHPGDLAGGGPAPLNSYHGAASAGLDSSGAPTWVEGGDPVETPFVRTPDFITAECVNRDGAQYLTVTVHGDPSDPRADDISGDVVVGGNVVAGWGLHLIDVTLSQGELIDLAQSQYAAWAAENE